MGISTRRGISERILFGEGKEDPEIVAKEIIDGKRPADWNMAGHPDHDVWIRLIKINQGKKEERQIRLNNQKQEAIRQAAIY